MGGFPKEVAFALGSQDDKRAQRTRLEAEVEGRAFMRNRGRGRYKESRQQDICYIHLPLPAPPPAGFLMAPVSLTHFPAVGI